MHGIPFEKSNFLRKPFGGLLGGPLLNALGSLEPRPWGPPRRRFRIGIDERVQRIALASELGPGIT